MIVVDTNILVYHWLPSPYTEQVKSLLLKDPDWRVPILWRSEIRSALGGAFRASIITYEQLIQILEEAHLFLDSKEYVPESERVMNLYKESKCSAYDCEYVALAQSLQAKLATFDKEILKEFPKIAFKPK